MYKAKVIEESDNGQGKWQSQRLGVFNIDGDLLIGEYKRSYPHFGTQTFAPFRRGATWYALYSSSYVATSVMKIHDISIEEVASEDKKNPNGFCPTEYFIPTYQIHEITFDNGRTDRYKEYDDDCFEPNKEIFYENFAFVNGCYWGDLYQTRFLNITKAHQGTIEYVDHGLIEPFGNLPLKDSVKLHSDDMNYTSIHVVTTKPLFIKNKDLIENGG